MKVLLLRTSCPRASKAPFEYPPVAQPLGVLQLASCVRQARPDDEVRVLDAAISLPTADDLQTVLDDFQPNVVGLSALNYEEALVRRFAALAKQQVPPPTVVVGGPLATASFERALAIDDVDVAVIGEAEQTLIELLDALERERPLLEVPGTAVRTAAGEPRRGPSRGITPNLDALPPVDWNDLELDAYQHVLNFNDTPATGPLTLLVTSRGCPFRCTFCHGSHGTKVRAWSAERLGDELERLARDHAVEEVHIGDDIFNVRPDRIHALHAETMRRGLSLRLAFPNGLRGDWLTREDVRLLAEAGCYSVCLSVETTSARLQQAIRKKLDVERVFAAAEWCRDEGMLTQAFVMLGFPTETRAEMEGTVNDVAASAFDVIRVFPVIPLPGTELFEEAVRTGFDAERKLGRLYFDDKGLVNATSLPDEEYAPLIEWARRRAIESPLRRRRLRDFFACRGLLEHPLVRDGHWRDAVRIDEPAE